MIIKNALIFDGKPMSARQDIFIDKNGIITQIAISDSVALPVGEDVIDADGKIVMPGLTDAHRHVWQAPFKGSAADLLLLEYLDKVTGTIGEKITAEDLYTINLFGYLQAASHGITTVFDWSHIMNSEEHADAAFQSAVDSGLNVLFFHSMSAIGRDRYWNNSVIEHPRYVEKLIRRSEKEESVKVGLGIRGPEFATMDVNRSDIAFARYLGCPISLHTGCSILGSMHKPVIQLYENDLLGNDLNLVHCSTLSAEEYELIASAGSLVTITPEAEFQTALGNPAVNLLVKHPEARWSIGTDIPTGSTDSLIFQQRMLLQYYRGEVNKTHLDKLVFPGEMPWKANDFFFASMDHANHYSGFAISSRVEVGKKACFSIYHLNELDGTAFLNNPVFYFMQEANIDSVIVNGKVLKTQAEWVRPEHNGLQRKVQEIVQRII